MPPVLPLLRRLFLLVLAVSLALPPLMADASSKTYGAQASGPAEAETYVPPCHGVGTAVTDAHSASKDAVDCSLLCLWLCAHANAVAAGGVLTPAVDPPSGPVLREDSLMRGPVRVVLLRPPIV